MQTIKILGVKIDNITYDKTIEKIEQFIESDNPHQICTVNPEFIMAAQKDTGFKNILNNADLSVPDGTGLLWASRYLSKRSTLRLYSGRAINDQDKVIKERVTGVDLVWRIADLAEKKGYTIYLLGAGPGVAEQTAIMLRMKYQKLKIVGLSEGIPQISQIRNSILDFNDFEKNLVSKIHDLKPNILLVAYGAPKQDNFIAKYKKELGVPVMMGVGGAFDFISGRVKRAPNWMQALHLEWLYRVIHEPRRLNRIITATVRFPWAIINSKSNQK